MVVLWVMLGLFVYFGIGMLGVVLGVLTGLFDSEDDVAGMGTAIIVGWPVMAIVCVLFGLFWVSFICGRQMRSWVRR